MTELLTVEGTHCSECGGPATAFGPGPALCANCYHVNRRKAHRDALARARRDRDRACARIVALERGHLDVLDPYGHLTPEYQRALERYDRAAAVVAALEAEADQ